MTTNWFLAVNPTDVERHAVAAALTEANPGRPLPGRRTDPANWHITLRFLGDTTDLQVDRLAYSLASVSECASGAVCVSDLGAFPRPAKATVLFAGVTDSEGILSALSAECEEAAQSAGFAPEDRPFVPHLTLARLRPARDVSHQINSYGDFSQKIAVDRISLMHGVQDRNGLRYVVADAFDLADV